VIGDDHKLVRLTVTTRWCVGDHELEYDDMTVLDVDLYDRYASDFEVVDPAEPAAELLDEKGEGEDVYTWRDRLDFLSVIDAVPEDQSDESLKARLREVAGD
jgi:hypothetical protein